MKEIGGYSELELKNGKDYYPDALKLNSGRNALFYILKAYGIKKIHIPYYICDSVLEPIKKLNIPYKFYPISKEFKPIVSVELDKNEFLLYVNYFGINEDNVEILAKKIGNLIIDNSQSFFSKPRTFPVFYSPRKFFGVPDGAYLYTDQFLDQKLEKATSFQKCIHLLKRFDYDSQQGYEDYKLVEESFSKEPLKIMSNLTDRVLKSINYKRIKRVRAQNFSYLHKKLKELNELNLKSKTMNGPLKYPFLVENKNLKKYLIENKIYISTYWQEVFTRVPKDSFEYHLTKYLIPIPIDQRYDINDMQIIIEKINDIL